MKPVDGTYRLTTDAIPPNPNEPVGLESTTVDYVIDPRGLHTNFGLLLWEPDPPPGMFRRADLAIRFLDETHFVATYAGKVYNGTYLRVA